MAICYLCASPHPRAFWEAKIPQMIPFHPQTATKYLQYWPVENNFLNRKINLVLVMDNSYRKGNSRQYLLLYHQVHFPPVFSLLFWVDYVRFSASQLFKEVWLSPKPKTCKKKKLKEDIFSDVKKLFLSVSQTQTVLFKIVKSCPKKKERLEVCFPIITINYCILYSELGLRFFL